MSSYPTQLHEFESTSLALPLRWPFAESLQGISVKPKNYQDD